MHQYSEPVSQECLYVWLYNAVDATDFRIGHHPRKIGMGMGCIQLQCFKDHIETDFVAKLKTVHKGFLRAIEWDRHPVDQLVFHSGPIGSVGESMYT
jgi:hypothetical protein